MTQLTRRFMANRNWNLAVIALAISSGVLYLADLANGERSEYYASIAVSMSKSLSNFFFGALDPAGTITLDKIPGSYWLPAIFVKLFGMSTWSVNAPNGIASIALVVVVAFTAKKISGNSAGIIAAVLIAATPIVTAVARSNQPQSFFLLMLALATNRAVAAFQNQSRRSLIAAGAWIAAGFHMYMIEAWALWPALIVAWFFTEQKLVKKVVDLLVAGFTSLALSLVWIVTVWLIPTGSRPYIGGTYHNNPWEMVFGYNALGRFTSNSGASAANAGNLDYRSFTPPFGGSSGFARLFNVQVAGQIAWLIPASVIAIILLLWLKRNRSLTIFLAGWFITFYVMFSLVSGMHQFYVSSLAIPMALLIAMAIEASFDAGKSWATFILLGPTVILAGVVAAFYSGYFSALPILQAVFAVVAVAMVLLFGTQASQGWRRVVTVTTIVSGLIVTPLAWSADAVNHPSAINPIAGPSVGFNGAISNQPPAAAHLPPKPHSAYGTGPVTNIFAKTNNSALIKYLIENRGGSKFLLATFGAQTAAPFITKTGENVLPIGGFDGSDPAPTLSQLKSMVASGELKFVLAPDQEPPKFLKNPGSQSQSAQRSNLQKWVIANCSLDNNAPSGSQLYLCVAK